MDDYDWGKFNDDLWGGPAQVDYSPTATPILSTAWSWSDLTNTAKEALTMYSSWQLQQLNFDRARRGLPPLNPAQYSPQVGLNLSPQTMQMIMYAALGIGAIMLLKGRR